MHLMSRGEGLEDCGLAFASSKDFCEELGLTHSCSKILAWKSRAGIFRIRHKESLAQQGGFAMAIKVRSMTRLG
jgi:hypothetical protein